MEQKSELIFCVVNAGFEDKVIECVSKIGITGGTFINAHGISKLEAEKFFGIAIQPEKQIVLILVTSDKKNAMLKVIYDNLGINKEAQGIAFSIPVDDMTENLKQQLFGKVEE